MKRLAIITARGGSKRIPRKNIKHFCGKPIMAYSIEAALSSNLFDEVMVSTDDEEIAQIAMSYGAKVPFKRSEKTSDDFATTADVIIEVLNTYGEMGQTFEEMAVIYPTAPFVTAEKLTLGFKVLNDEQSAMVMPVVPFSFPPMRGVVIENNQLKYRWPEMRNRRSQDLEAIYHDCGQFYCYNVSRFLELGGQIVEAISPIIMKETEVQDIDNLEDWAIAELKYQLMSKNK